MNTTNNVWINLIEDILENPHYEVSPRGMPVKEKLNGSYTVQMPAYLSLNTRKVNYNFMFAEAAWIISGSNRLSDITPYMKAYANFSDDNQFLRGAYGPKVVDQLPYIVDTLSNDPDTRQAVMTIWRERPGPSKDIPCTVAIQFLIRDNQLHLIVTMRSNDAVLGFTYDVFTFSMIGLSVLLLLRDRGAQISLGELHVNAGSLHIYEQHFNKLNEWKEGFHQKEVESYIKGLENSTSYEELIERLKRYAEASV